jgi:hypothetical protein
MSFNKLSNYVSSQLKIKPVKTRPASARIIRNHVLKMEICYNPKINDEYKYVSFLSLLLYRFRNINPLKKYSSCSEFIKVI